MGDFGWPSGLELVGLKYRPEKREFSAKRGAIEDFSKNSRFRFMRLMATIDGEMAGLPDFVALTYPDEWSKDWRVWKRDRDAFTKALVGNGPMYGDPAPGIPTAWGASFPPSTLGWSKSGRNEAIRSQDWENVVAANSRDKEREE